MFIKLLDGDESMYASTILEPELLALAHTINFVYQLHSHANLSCATNSFQLLEQLQIDSNFLTTSKIYHHNIFDLVKHCSSKIWYA